MALTDLEVWLPVHGYEGLYEVSNHARIRSLPRVAFKKDGTAVNLKGMLKKVTPMGNGYLHATFTKEGRTTQLLLHVVVAKAFVANENNLPHVNHKDMNPKNCLPENLEWVTHRENIVHARDNGKLNAMSNPKRRLKFDIETVNSVKRSIACGGKSHSQIAEEHGMSRRYVGFIANGRNWAEVNSHVS